jgi:hypothetical protein
MPHTPHEGLAQIERRLSLILSLWMSALVNRVG